MRNKTIEVTQKDIDKGVALEECNCPVARALCRTFKKKLGTFKVYGGQIRTNTRYYKVLQGITWNLLIVS